MEDQLKICGRCGDMQLVSQSEIDIDKALRDAYYAGLQFGVAAAKSAVQQTDPLDDTELARQAGIKFAAVKDKVLFQKNKVVPEGGDVQK